MSDFSIIWKPILSKNFLNKFPTANTVNSNVTLYVIYFWQLFINAGQYLNVLCMALRIRMQRVFKHIGAD